MTYQPIRLSPTQIEQPKADGFLILENFLPPDFFTEYIYGRYKRVGNIEMDESFCPVLWQKDSCRSPHLSDYCTDSLSNASISVV
ncbi:hypothetical protein C1752_03434 [Acaryochloris thomasi RCC1774]|uniref:Uncharacterized protein n=1 Tax=Acaryochloris thomasi RCC1774 TaxID=1764569 RepID=A0A2W1JGB8_9CYAN|nr:hypothetical protein [Acaryochloris thomasi]PZD72598.1 hypothetical protein C1752_03434 [Acaryochloris thomasi RCC1774]